MYLTYSSNVTRQKYIILCLPAFIIYFFSLVLANSHSIIYDQPINEPPSPITGHDQKCQPLNSPFCNINSYQTLLPFRNTFGHGSLDLAVAELHKYAYLLSNEPCKSMITLFLCALYAPVCVYNPIDHKLLLPCRDDCEQARKVCKPFMAGYHWPDEWECSKFNWHHEDPLCVINNINKQNHSTSSFEIASEYLPTITPSNNDSSNFDSKLTVHSALADTNKSIVGGDKICEHLFDCRLGDPARNNHALCIDPSYVCNGKIDCVIEGKEHEPDAGLDEQICNSPQSNCSDGQLACDGKCISRNEICNGERDCSSGIDEQDCEVVGLVQSIIFVCTFSMAIFLLARLIIRWFKNNDKSDDSVIEDKPRYMSAENECDLEDNRQSCLPDVIAAAQSPCIVVDQNYNHQITERCPIYQEPAFSIQTRSDYERLNVGGLSGASSVYAYSAYHTPAMFDYSKEPPAAPPPTPAYYSTGSLTKLADIYENMNSSCNKLDLLN